LELPSYQDLHKTNRDLTDSRWEVIEKLLDDQRKRWHSLWEIVNAILSINRTSAQWRDLDSKCPP
jgi:transposase